MVDGCLKSTEGGWFGCQAGGSDEYFGSGCDDCVSGEVDVGEEMGTLVEFG